jgi:hypothetical protein
MEGIVIVLALTKAVTDLAVVAASTATAVLFAGTAAEIAILGTCTICDTANPIITSSGVDVLIEETLCPGEELVADMNGDCVLVDPTQQPN